MLDGRNQQEHGGDESSEFTHGGSAVCALHQGNGDDARQRHGGEHLCQRFHGGRGGSGRHRQAAQALADAFKAFSLGALGGMQTDVTVGEDVFFHHVSQRVGRGLAGFRERVELFGQPRHNEGDSGQQDGDKGGELPVEVEQVADKGDQGDSIAHQGHDGVDQQGRAVVNFIDDRVGQFTGGLVGEQHEFGVQQLAKHGLAQVAQALGGDFGDGHFSQKTGCATDAEQGDEGDGDDPQLDTAFLETPVQQGPEGGWNQGFCRRGQSCGQKNHQPGTFGVAKIGNQAGEALAQGFWRVVDGGGSSQVDRQ